MTKFKKSVNLYIKRNTVLSFKRGDLNFSSQNFSGRFSDHFEYIAKYLLKQFLKLTLIQVSFCGYSC